MNCSWLQGEKMHIFLIPGGVLLSLCQSPTREKAPSPSSQRECSSLRGQSRGSHHVPSTQSFTVLDPAPPNQRHLPEEELKVYSIKVMLPSPNKETRPLPRNIVKPQTSKSKIHTHKQRRLCLKFQASSFSADLLISCKEKKRMEKHISICSKHPSAVSWLTSGFCTFSAFSLPAALSPPKNIVC